jgi:hypothetical protein
VFWRRRKKKTQSELTDEQIEGIIRGYSEVLKRAMGNHLPRRMRRAMSRGQKGWDSLSAGQQRAQLQEIRQKGIGSWLEDTTHETYEQIASYVADPAPLEEDLREALSAFKKEHSIR